MKADREAVTDLQLRQALRSSSFASNKARLSFSNGGKVTGFLKNLAKRAFSPDAIDKAGLSNNSLRFQPLSRLLQNSKQRS